MSKIMVIKRNLLFTNDHFIGFLPSDKINFKQKLLKNYEYKEREAVEENQSFKQPVAYAVIVNLKTQKIFTYQRASNLNDYRETRLYGKWSWGIGGHIEQTDKNTQNAIESGLKRELKEEVGLIKLKKTKLLGYINLEYDVHAVHFGLLYIVETQKTEIKPSSLEIASGEFKTIAEIKQIIDNPNYKIEAWSKTAISPISKYLKLATRF